MHTAASSEPGEAVTPNLERAPSWRVTDRKSLAPGAVCAGGVLVGSSVLYGLPSPIHLDAPGARAAIETLVATAALVSAAVLLVTFRRGRQRGDLLLFTALTAAGVTGLVFSALPALAGSEVLGFGSAPQAVCAAFAAGAFVAAAFAPAGRIAGRGMRPLWLAGGALVAVIAVASLSYVITGRATIGAASTQAGVGAAAQHPVLLMETAFSTAALLVAGAGFLTRSERATGALAAASFLLAAAQLQYLALPAMAPDWLTARDGLRLVAYGLLMMAALTRYGRARRELTVATVAAERDRIARDLHDGLAQDLAYIALQGQRLSTELGAEHPLTLAARRAVTASRNVIVDLAAPTAASTGAALREVADELTARFEVDVEVRVLDDTADRAVDELDSARREQLVRIVREAIVNAARHGAARHVTVLVDRDGDQLRLRVSDDGHGAEQARLRPRMGHGLHMMAWRARQLGGEMVTRPGCDGGVEVEVTFPRAGRSGGAR